MEAEAVMERIEGDWTLSAALALLLLSGCGAGVAGVVAGTGSSRSGGDAPTVLASFQVRNPKVSPATLQLRVSGAAPVRAALFYERSGQSRQPMTRLAGLNGNTVVLADPGADLSWDFAAEPLLLGPGERLADGVTLSVEFPGGTLPDGGAIELALGNDPPEIEELVTPTGALTGVVPVGVRVSDSSSDVISIALEWRRQGEPDSAFQPATPASVFGDEEPLEGIQATPEGVARTFSWNTAADLLDEDADVELRFTPDDGTEDAQGNPVGRGASVVSNPFRIQNHGRAVLAGFQVTNTKLSPARLRLVLVHAQSEPVEVELFFEPPGGGLQPMKQLAGGNPVVLPSSPTGVESELAWDFAAELGTGSFLPDVRLRVVLPGGVVPTNGELVLGLGNDAPVVQSFVPVPTDPLNPEESAGTVELRLRIADSSADVVDVLVEWRRAGDPPDAWLPATAAGIFPAGIETNPEGVELSFFWNTNVDLAEEEDVVLFRVTASDGTEVGAPFVTQAPFRVDNNAAPIVQLFNDLVVLNPDERRGIPIPFRVIDEEGDRVEAIFQWRRSGEGFPPLPADEAGLAAILADPVLRSQKHICSAYPRHARGRVLPVDEWSVRLPELASGESWILAHGIVGRELELLRPSQVPAPITSTWDGNPLVAPVAALPVGDGSTAFVLDASAGSTCLREIELATGAVVRDIATSSGLPSAMAYERFEQSVLVASHFGSVWRVDRIELSTGAVTDLHVAGGTSEPGPIRGLLVLGTDVALATVGSSLVMLDHADPLAAREVTLLENLATPWGLVADALNANQIYLAERDAVTSTGTGRILSVELDSFERKGVVVKTQPVQVLERPSSMALARNGARLLVVAGETGGVRRLVGLDLGGRGGNVPFSIGPPIPGEIAQVASGPDGLRLLALPSTNELLVGGGLEQRRTIAAIEPQLPGEPRMQRVALERPLDPPARPGQPWRIADGPETSATAAGNDTIFLWNSGDADDRVFLRGLVRDGELGIASEGVAPKTVRASLDVTPLSLGGPSTTLGPRSVAAADFDDDGDLDLVSANSDGDNLTVFFQRSPGALDASPVPFGDSSITEFPASVTAADLDGDGDQDFVSANLSSSNLTVFFQTSPGSFDPNPVSLGGPSITESPTSIAAADLDGDGDQDLVSGARQGLTVFFQRPGGFDPIPLVLGGPSITDFPASVTTADVDGDGDLDLVSANTGHNLTVFFQRSPGSFDPTPLALGGLSITDSPASIAAADLDGDGDQDLVSANSSGDSLTVFFQRSSGTFDSTPLVIDVPAATIGGGPASVAAADLDGDGDRDLVSAGGTNLAVFFQDSPGSFDPTPLLLGGAAITSGPVSVIVADLDGDGHGDLVSANLGSAQNLTVFLRSSPGSFATSPLALGDFSTTSNPFSVTAADLDGDGDLELISANKGRSTLGVFFQSSPGSFDPSPLLLGGFQTTGAPVSIASGDLDDDGDMDLASANRAGDKLTVFFQLSPGSFDPNPLSLGGASVTDFPNSVAAADLDGDGDLDLASANARSHTLTLFRQHGSGGLDPSPLVLGDHSITRSPVCVTAADLDGDGDLDLVSANQFGNNLTRFFQGSSGTFSPSPTLLAGFPQSAIVGDLDGDGDLDLVSANRFWLTGFLQDSTGTLGPFALPSIAAADAPQALAAADLDRDGDLDLASASESSNRLTLLVQSSPGTFDSNPLVLGELSLTRSPVSIAAADIDGDGDLDLVSANQLGSNLTVFWGGR